MWNAIIIFSICQCFSCFEEKELFLHWTLNVHVREVIKLLVYFVKYCSDIVFFSLLKYFSSYMIISISYLSFCFVEINTLWKSDRMSIPIRSDYTRTVGRYEYTAPYGPDRTRTVWIRIWSVTDTFTGDCRWLLISVDELTYSPDFHLYEKIFMYVDYNFDIFKTGLKFCCILVGYLKSVLMVLVLFGLRQIFLLPGSLF